MNKSTIRASLLSSLLILAGVGVSGLSQAADCPTGVSFNFSQSVQFGDGFSQSLPISGIDVQSSPGQIQDCIVVATGVNGGPTTTNSSTGIDDAFETPNGTTNTNPFFSTGTSTDPSPTFSGDQSTTWDATLSQLSSFLNGGALLFYFNHNQTNAGSAIDQDLFIWGRITLEDLDGNAANLIYDFTAMNPWLPPGTLPLSNFGCPAGSACFDPTGTNYTSTGFSPDQLADFVRARGQICLGGDGSPGSPIVPCDGNQAATFNTNLGANNVANAIFFPELQAYLNMVGFGGYDVMHVDLRMGCSLATACPAGSVLNNGYEQLFIVSAPQPTIPEPATLLLIGLGMLGMVGMLRRKEHLQG